MQKENGYYTDKVKIYMPGGMFDGSSFIPNPPSDESPVMFSAELSPSDFSYVNNEENEGIDCHDFYHQLFTAMGLVAVGGAAVYYALNIMAESQGFDQFDPMWG